MKISQFSFTSSLGSNKARKSIKIKANSTVYRCNLLSHRRVCSHLCEQKGFCNILWDNLFDDVYSENFHEQQTNIGRNFFVNIFRIVFIWLSFRIAAYRRISEIAGIWEKSRRRNPFRNFYYMSDAKFMMQSSGALARSWWQDATSRKRLLPATCSCNEFPFNSFFIPYTCLIFCGK